MLSEQNARDIAKREVDRLGGIDALEGLYHEMHEPNPVQEFIVDDELVFVRLRHVAGPASVDVDPYTFEIRDGRLVSVTGSE
jgi:hypothetical protein